MNDRWRLQEKVEIRVPFYDVDGMQIVWHGHYVKYMEVARCALLDQIEYGYEAMVESGYTWPVIDLRVRYPRPAKFGQIITIDARIIEYANRLVIDYEIRDKHTAERMTRARTTQVAVDMTTGEMLLASPRILLERLHVVG